MAKEQKLMLDREAIAKLLGCTSFHAGELLRKGKIQGAVKVQRGKTNVMKWIAPKDAVEAYLNTRKVAGHLPNGVRKYNIYLDETQLAQVQELFPGVRVEVANPTKEKAEAEVEDGADQAPQELEDLLA